MRKVGEKLGKDEHSVDELIQIVKMLRSPDGCPWDKVQTHDSIRFNLIEEAYEVVSAIDEKDSTGLEEELGDVLLQVVFHSVLSEEEGTFSFSEVVEGICEKLKFRHPHVFGEAKAVSSTDALNRWEEAKQAEKHQETIHDTLMAVPRAFPSLLRTQKVEKRAVRGGFDLGDLETTLAQLEMGSETIRENLGKNGADFAPLIGEMLFLCCNIARLLDVEAEDSLLKTTDAFISEVNHWEESF